MQLKSLLIASLAALTAAQGTEKISSVTCGRNVYSPSEIDDAVGEGCRLYEERRQIGRNNYPHRFNNREGLDFATSGPYQEFPIIRNGNYTGGSPGADRVAFDPAFEGSCVYVGAMTHTDAPTRNGFIECEEQAAEPVAGNDTDSNSDDDDSAGSMATPALHLVASGVVAWLVLAL